MTRPSDPAYPTRRRVVTGLAADNCVLFTAGDAFMLEYDVIVPSDCVASGKRPMLTSALEHMQRVVKAKVCGSDDIALRRRR